MRLRNITPQDRAVPSLGVTIPAGGTTDDLDEPTAAGFVLQTDIWRAVGADDRAAQADTVAQAAQEG